MDEIDYQLYPQESKLQLENRQLRAALVKIRDSKYNAYENNEESQYGIGVCDGHRYCSAIARRVLEELE